MNYFDFYPYGTDSIVLSFECDECSELVESEEIAVPEQNYMAEKISDGETINEGYAICENCEKEFHIDVYSSGMGIVDNLLEKIPISVNEIYHNEEDYDELIWEIDSTEQLEIYKNHIDSIEKLLEQSFEKKVEFNLLVMLYAHIVASVESFLSSTFIHQVTNSEKFTKRLIETDPEFGKRKFTLKEIYEEQEKVKITVASYLKSIIFHDLKKIKPMYKDVLDFDLNDISWLFKAVKKRHDCVHRAGYDKDGNKISISKKDINILIEQCDELTKKIDSYILNKLTKENI